MKFSIQFSLTEQDPITLEVSRFYLKETSIRIHELVSENETCLLQTSQYNLNTLLDFSKSKPYQIIYFNYDKTLSGVSYAINKSKGSFVIQTQAKWVLLIPKESCFSNALINKIERFEINIDKANKTEILKELDQESPIARFAGAGIMITTVSRMKLEKELNIPISWRTGTAISVASGKRSNEMQEQEWNDFYYALCDNLKRSYLPAYQGLFPFGKVL